jgi:Reverse transcriptase (RNA-dependent DNA polymerase)
MLKAEVIEPATSEWAIPIVLVAKPDGSTRFCLDYRRLNAVTVRNSYPLPRMDECIDSLGDARIFTTLDCNSGYWQIPVRPVDREKTTFTSHEGLYWFLRMPLGFRNAPVTLQRFVDIFCQGSPGRPVWYNWTTSSSSKKLRRSTWPISTRYSTVSIALD